MTLVIKNNDEEPDAADITEDSRITDENVADTEDTEAGNLFSLTYGNGDQCDEARAELDSEEDTLELDANPDAENFVR